MNKQILNGEEVAILKKIINRDIGYCYSKMEPSETMSAIILDLETTGLDFTSDEAISLVAIKVTLDLDRMKVYSIDGIVEQFREPKNNEIGELTQRLTGLTAEFLKGKEFDKEEISEFLADGSVIISHNAKFDKNFFEGIFGSEFTNPWVCTKDDIKWMDDYHVESFKLEYILFKAGMFYETHNAKNDCFAVIEMINSYYGILEKILSFVDSDIYRVYAAGAPFSVKEDLRRKGFRWSPERKMWFKERLSDENVVATLKEIDGIYGRADLAIIEECSGNQRFEVI